MFISGDTPLMRGVRNHNGAIVDFLVSSKAKVHLADKVGDTALHIAIRARSKGKLINAASNPHPHLNQPPDTKTYKTIVLPLFDSIITDRLTDRQTDRMDGRTKPFSYACAMKKKHKTKRVICLFCGRGNQAWVNRKLTNAFSRT